MVEEPGSREPLANALLSLHSRAGQQAAKHRLHASRWGSIYFSIGLPAAILAAIAGATGLASTAGRIPAAIIALVSAALGAAATFLDSKTRKEKNENLAAAWQILTNDIEVNLILDIEDVTWLQGARQVLNSHLEREAKLLQGNAPDAKAEAEFRARESELKGRLLANAIGQSLSTDTPGERNP